jgi:hypothetical protein
MGPDVPKDPKPCRCGKPGVVRLRDERGVLGACASCAVRLCREAAARRQAAMAGSKTTVDAANGQSDQRGMWGELAFGRRYRLPVDIRVNGRGDGGADFRTAAGTVDVKTWCAGGEPELHRQTRLKDGREKPGHADVYVLAHRADGKTRLLGWEYGAALVGRPTRQSPIGEVHWMAVRDLRQMSAFDELLEPPDVGRLLREAGTKAFGLRYDDEGRLVET